MGIKLLVCFELSSSGAGGHDPSGLWIGKITGRVGEVVSKGLSTLSSRLTGLLGYGLFWSRKPLSLEDPRLLSRALYP